MNRIRLDQVDENPHDSVMSDLACGQWRLAARVDVLISDARFAAVPLLCVSGLSGRVATKVGIYRMLRWMLSPERYTDLLLSYRYLGSLMFRNIFDYVAYVVGAPLASAPSLTHCNGHRMTPTIPTSRLCTPPSQHHDLDSV